MRILVVHGPNLNLLGEREPEVYGKMTLAELNQRIAEHAHSLDVLTDFYQSNHEGRIVDFLHEHRHSAQGCVMNPAAFTHYSYAIRDAVSAIELPVVEVHLSDIHNREPFRRVSVIRDVCIAQISGKGIDSYIQGLELLVRHLR